MPSPQRVKVQGDLFHGVVPAGAVYVGRAAPGLRQSPYRNRHRVGKPCRECLGEVHTLPEALALFERDFLADEALLARASAELAGWDLACWCRVPMPGEPDLCHAALLCKPGWRTQAGQLNEHEAGERIEHGGLAVGWPEERG